MLEKLMPKGWTQLVDECVERTIKEEISRQLATLFPEVREKADRVEAGFSYSMRQYIEKRWTEILKADPEIDTLIREGLRDAIVNGFKAKPE